MTEPINYFIEEYRWLSNFEPSPIIVYYLDLSNAYIARTVEHGYQAMKAANLTEFSEVLAAETAGRAKRMGRQVTIRHDWEAIKFDVMEALLLQKFRNPQLRKMLIETGDAVLTEGNNWNDTLWGECPLGTGDNRLGKLLMKIREELK